MAVAQYPTPANSLHPSEPSGPTILILQDLPADFKVMVKEFKDGGSSQVMESANAKVLRWFLLYDGLDASQIAPVDTHYNAAFGIFLPFDFRHPKTDVLYSDVHYESFSYPQHNQSWIQRREIVLVKWPTG